VRGKEKDKMTKELLRPAERMERDEEYKGEITHGKLAQTLGRAMVETEFRRELLSSPERVGRDLGLNPSGIEILAGIDPEVFERFAKMLGAKLTKDAATVIFCAV
jgi:hypothetical protein